MSTHDVDHLALSADQVRWSCPSQWLNFTTTDALDLSRERPPIPSVIEEALRFGLLTQAPGQHVFIRGVEGSGRRRLLKQCLEHFAPAPRQQFDRCYVHNFLQPDRPVLLTLEAGGATDFTALLKRLQSQIEALPMALNAEPFSAALSAKQREVEQRVKAVLEPVKAALAKENLALVPVKSGEQIRTMLLPLIDAQPQTLEVIEQLWQSGQLSEEQYGLIQQRLRDHQSTAAQVQAAVASISEAGGRELQALSESLCRDYLQQATLALASRFSQLQVSAYLDALVEDVLDQLPALLKGELDITGRYGVNVVHRAEASAKATAPVRFERSASVLNLLGSIEPVLTEQGAMVADYRGVRPGSLLQADGGYLVLRVEDLVREPGAYTSLIRTLRSGQLDIVPDTTRTSAQVVLKPEPIPLALKVVLIGDGSDFYQLSSNDPAFSSLFKVLVDVESTLDRQVDAAVVYSLRLAQMVAEEGLLPFESAAVAALLEHGARVAASGNKVTARLGRIADIAREAAFLATEQGLEAVGREQVKQTIRRTKARAGQATARFAESMARGAIMIATRGAVVGQINGLAVMQSGLLAYGFPARITTSAGVGRAGLIDIEGQADLSGSIHTKGFHILGGLLRELIDADHPLAFSASIAFEQSYGGIDGDSASGAEMCCLLSALTGVPVRQDRAMTGAIDQKGHLQVIGGVNEKIEGFFDACCVEGLTGEQAVVIPKPNAADLMLREDVVAAIAEGRFAVYAVENIRQALGLMLAIDAPGSLLEQADAVIGQTRAVLERYYQQSSLAGGRE